MKEKKSERENKRNFMYLALCMLVFFPMVAVADSVTVTNTVTSSAHSGGNISTGGSVIEGKTISSVSVKTVINGEVVEDYTDVSNQPIHYEKSTVMNDGTTTVTTHNSVHASDERSSQGTTTVVQGRERTSQNATHRERAPESTKQSGENYSSAGDVDVHGDTVAPSIAAEESASTGVATRMLVNIKSLFIKIIHFLSW